MLHPVHHHGPGGAVEDEAGDAQGIGIRMHVRARHDELVVGGARHDVGLAAGHRQPARHLTRHVLSGPCPELLVHVLPAVELHEQHGQRTAGALCAGQCLVELILEQGTVGRLGQHLVHVFGYGHGGCGRGCGRSCGRRRRRRRRCRLGLRGSSPR